MVKCCRLESTLTLKQRDQPAARRSGWLRVVHPGACSIELCETRTVIGRTPSGPLSHPTVSRQHFVVEWDPEIARFVGEDLGSKNGTWVDGVALASSRRALDDGAVVRLGETVLVVELDVTPGDGGDASEAIPGDASATRRLRVQVATAARDPSPVLLLGETGVGKERIAAELHRLSGRAGPFRAINCAELTPELVESQLFGHARGSFTGALRDHAGVFRSAEHGTLLLDEIGELPPALQPKLLRVLQEHEVLPVGEPQAVAIDVRVIAATNRDLPALIETGGFRRDLYARLAFWELRVPPLRARRADVMPWLARLYDQWWARRAGAPPAPLVFEATAVEAILLAPWPDNLRGLDRLVHRLASQPRATICEADLELGAPPAPPPIAAKPRPPVPTADELRAALAAHNGSIRAVAKHYGRDRKQIYRWLKELELE